MTLPLRVWVNSCAETVVQVNSNRKKIWWRIEIDLGMLNDSHFYMCVMIRGDRFENDYR